MASFVLLQWNARGIRKKLEFLNFLYRKSFDVACVQESQLGPRSIFNVKGYSIERTDSDKQGKWGVLTLIKAGINYTRIAVPDNVQAVHLLIDRPGASSINLINVYAPPLLGLPGKFLEGIVNLPSLVLVGDFNAHHPSWGYSTADASGTALANILEPTDLVILNNKIPTLFTYTGHYGVLDLSILSPSLALRASYERLNDPMASDHYPVVIDFNLQSLMMTRTQPRWKFKKANWSSYQVEVEKRCSAASYVHDDVDATYKNIKTIITEAANAAIPRTTGKIRRRRLVYWCDDIKKAIKERKSAFNVWKRCHTSDAWVAYKKAKAAAQRVMRQCAQAHWRKYCEGLDLSRPTSAVKVWRAIASMQGNGATRCIPNLCVNGKPVVSSKDKADAFGEHFASVSSDGGYEEPFVSIKRLMDHAMQPLFSKTESLGSNDALNSSLTFNELKIALASVRTNTSPGPDCIPYTLYIT